mgnify:CR=1 FL=1
MRINFFCEKKKELNKRERASERKKLNPIEILWKHKKNSVYIIKNFHYELKLLHHKPMSLIDIISSIQIAINNGK